LVVVVPDDPRGVEGYRDWIEHLARSGAAVLFPDGGPASLDLAVAREALAESRDRIGVSEARLAEGGVYVGHGRGAVTAARLAAGWYRDDVPLPRALLLLMPAGSVADVGADLADLPIDTRVLFVASADDAYADPSEVALWSRLSHVPAAWRRRIVLPSDYYGTPALIADANAPLSGPPGRADAHDWLGTWRWLDALVGCIHSGVWCDVAGPDGEADLDLGSWADGRPVRPAAWSAGPPQAPWRVAFLPGLHR
jgi:hypothetical protein